MKKNYIYFIPVIILLTACFIPFNVQKSVLIKTPFLTLYGQLSLPENWTKWRPDLRKITETDSGKLMINRQTHSFTIKTNDQYLTVTPSGPVFNMDDHFKDGHPEYTYSVLPAKTPDKSIIEVSKKTTGLNYLLHLLKPTSFSDTHIDDLKNYMETDTLFYGCRIFKTRVPESDLIVIRSAVPNKAQFAEAEKSFKILQQYVKTNHLKQMQPVIAQYVFKNKDSVQVNVGLFIDKKVAAGQAITYMHMPKGGPLYAARFNGPFYKKLHVYDGLRKYFDVHHYQSAILPFEMYLNNQLPQSDSTRINIQVNFSAYF
jgi:effector-binding domain-containing protein